MPRTRQFGKRLDRRTNNPQNPFIGSETRQIFLLDTTKRLCRSRIASQNNQRAPFVEKMEHSLLSKFIYDLERPRTLRSPRIIPQIEIIISRQAFAHLFENSKTSVSRIKNSDGTYIRRYFCRIHY